MSKATAKGVSKVGKKSYNEVTDIGGLAFKKVYGLIDDESDEEFVDDGEP